MYSNVALYKLLFILWLYTHLWYVANIQYTDVIQSCLLKVGSDSGSQWLICFSFSVTLSEWRGRQRNHHCPTHPRCALHSLYLYISLTWVYQFCLSEVLHLPSHSFTLCCRRLRLQMNPPPFIHRMITPQMKRSWPPPPVISGPPCTTWMQIWTLTNTTSLTHLILRHLLTRTVFLFRLQVRHTVAFWPLFASHSLQPPVPKQMLTEIKVYHRQTALKGNSKLMFGWTVVYSNQQPFSLLIFVVAQWKKPVGPVFYCPLTPRRATSSQRLSGSTHLGQRWNREHTAYDSISPELNTRDEMSLHLFLCI